MMEEKYTKSHLLWPVWDLQNQIILRGGIINRQSDLLSYFEGKSLIPDSNPVDITYTNVLSKL
jgi:hypothetical protein